MARRSKLLNQRIHAKRRAEERFGLKLNRDDYRELVLKIRGGKAEFLGRESLRLTHWAVEWSGQSMHAVYDSKRHNVVTVMYPGSTFASNGGEAPNWAKEADPRHATQEGWPPPVDRAL